MAIPAMSPANFSASSQQAVQSLGHKKHGGHHAHSISDVDAQSSSVAGAGSSTGKAGSKVDLMA